VDREVKTWRYQGDGCSAMKANQVADIVTANGLIRHPT